MPRRSTRVGTILGVYFVVLLASEWVHWPSGYSISDRAGKHYLNAGDNPELEMTAQGYAQHELQLPRIFSSPWMVFTFCSATYLLFAKDDTALDAPAQT